MPNLAEKNACDLLDADHLAVKAQFVEYARLAYVPASHEAPARATIARSICDELTVHALIEEEIFYPALRQAVPATADVVDEALAEHQQVKTLVAQIRALQGADDAMDQLVAELARAVEDHVKEERDELFPKARATAGLDLVALGQQLRQRQQEAMKEAAGR